MRKKILLFVLILLWLSCQLLADQMPTRNQKNPQLSSGLTFGYYGGSGLQLNGTISNLSSEFPFDLRMGFGFARIEPGDALAARKIFINNATNGTPEKNGKLWDYRLDFLLPMKLFSFKKAFFFAGPRYSHYIGNFKYIGGNEDFDIKSNHWGAGAGIETYFAISRVLELVITSGIDYYSASTLKGHDTIYSPNGEPVNQREDYTYSDADNAIKQPKIEARLMIGFNYNF